MKKVTILASALIVTASIFMTESKAFQKRSFLENLPSDQKDVSHPGHAPLIAARDENSNELCVKTCNSLHVPDVFVSKVDEIDRKKWIACTNKCRKGKLVRSEYYLIPEAMRNHEEVKKIVLQETAKDKFKDEWAKLNVTNLKKRAQNVKKRFLAKLSLS